jgi:hypothetical protein
MKAQAAASACMIQKQHQPKPGHMAQGLRLLLYIHSIHTKIHNHVCEMSCESGKVEGLTYREGVDPLELHKLHTHDIQSTNRLESGTVPSHRRGMPTYTMAEHGIGHRMTGVDIWTLSSISTSLTHTCIISLLFSISFTMITPMWHVP